MVDAFLGSVNINLTQSQNVSLLRRRNLLNRNLSELSKEERQNANGSFSPESVHIHLM